jgi:hypothetical protein
VRLPTTRHVHGTPLLARGAPSKVVSERPTRVRIPQGPSRCGNRRPIITTISAAAASRQGIKRGRALATRRAVTTVAITHGASPTIGHGGGPPAHPRRDRLGREADPKTDTDHLDRPSLGGEGGTGPDARAGPLSPLFIIGILPHGEELDLAGSPCRDLQAVASQELTTRFGHPASFVETDVTSTGHSIAKKGSA